MTNENKQALVDYAGNSVTDISFPAPSEQGRRATHIGYTGSFSRVGLAAVGRNVLTNNPRDPLENALIATVEAELLVMHSFCLDSFPCDVTSVMAMRISRSIVSTICQLGKPGLDTGLVAVSKATQKVLLEALERVEQINRQFESRLDKLPTDSPEWKVWIS